MNCVVQLYFKVIHYSKAYLIWRGKCSYKGTRKYGLGYAVEMDSD